MRLLEYATNVAITRNILRSLTIVELEEQLVETDCKGNTSLHIAVQSGKDGVAYGTLSSLHHDGIFLRVLMFKRNVYGLTAYQMALAQGGILAPVMLSIVKGFSPDTAVLLKKKHIIDIHKYVTWVTPHVTYYKNYQNDQLKK